MMVCKRIQYSGRVQGVGFRFTAQELAEGLPVSGYVRNLPAGDVELVAEGAAKAVDEFVNLVSERMAGYIEHSTVEEMPPSGCSGFHIRH
jgi:acylphosphatase